ncbi:MAG TPA: YetF domain-containing protein [Aggregatilineales bacterium]|nr:YetF domain-containing protein [Aggregatilineales bacterium]
MDAVLRSVAVYVVLLVIFRVAGKRALSEITTFDFVLLLIIGNVIEPGITGDDYSVTNGLLIIITLVVVDIGMSLIKQKSRGFAKLVDGVPLVIVEDGQPIEERMRKARLDVSDILTSARQSQGLERMDQIKYAILERSGGISIVPAEK